MQRLTEFRAITAPLDTIKIRLQLNEHKKWTQGRIWRVLSSTYKNEGIRAFWKGNIPAEYLYILFGGIQFASYSILNSGLTETEKKFGIKISSGVHSLISGIGAGAISTVATYPFDLFRTRLAANLQKELVSMTSLARKICMDRGLRGLFQGLLPAVLSTSLTAGIMFWTYEVANNLGHKYTISFPFKEGIFGFIAGVTAKGILFPLDTLRKRVQMSRNMMPGDKIMSGGIMRTAGTLLKNEGILGFYKGFTLSVFKTGPTSAISLFMFEYSLNIARRIENLKLS